MANMIENNCFVSPTLKKYEDYATLTAMEVREILRIGENKIYDFLKVAPFRAEKIKGTWYVFAASFWEWYFGERSDVA